MELQLIHKIFRLYFCNNFRRFQHIIHFAYRHIGICRILHQLPAQIFRILSELSRQICLVRSIYGILLTGKLSLSCVRIIIQPVLGNFLIILRIEFICLRIQFICRPTELCHGQFMLFLQKRFFIDFLLQWPIKFFLFQLILLLQ